LRTYWQPYLDVADQHGVGFVMDTATWRANPDWGARLGYDERGLDEANAAATRFARELADGVGQAVVDGVVGPRGDGYVVGETMTEDDAQRYHTTQVRSLVDAGVDQVTAVTLTYPAEATGFVRAAAAVGVPAVVSFTVETDGRLPNGQALRDGVETVDRDTDGYALGFMVNCAHPTHLGNGLDGGDWLGRITGLRANASTMSHAELDEAVELDEGDPEDLAMRYQELLDRLPALDVLGGCCGTDHRHIRAIADACLRAPDVP
jgi:homocysteine S-methyltransferase